MTGFLDLLFDATICGHIFPKQRVDYWQLRLQILYKENSKSLSREYSMCKNVRDSISMNKVIYEVDFFPEENLMMNFY